MYGRGADGSVLAVGTILTQLLIFLVAKGALSNADVRSVLADTTNELLPQKSIVSHKDALDVIAEIMKRFP
jgi:hypothetical protein